MTASCKVDGLLTKSLINRALIANALCAIAEEEAHAGDVTRAVETVKALRGVLGEVSLILSGDTSDLRSGSLQDAAELLDGLGSRIAAVEKALSHCAAQGRA